MKTTTNLKIDPESWLWFPQTPFFEKLCIFSFLVVISLLFSCHEKKFGYSEFAPFVLQFIRLAGYPANETGYPASRVSSTILLLTIPDMLNPTRRQRGYRYGHKVYSRYPDFVTCTYRDGQRDS